MRKEAKAKIHLINKRSGNQTNRIIHRQKPEHSLRKQTLTHQTTTSDTSFLVLVSQHRRHVLFHSFWLPIQLVTCNLMCGLSETRTCGKIRAEGRHRKTKYSARRFISCRKPVGEDRDGTCSPAAGFPVTLSKSPFARRAHTHKHVSCF